MAIETDDTIHSRESKVWLAHDISSIRAVSMNEGIEKAANNTYLFIVINADNIHYMPKLKFLRDVTSVPILIATSSYTMQEQCEAITLGADFFGQLSDDPNDNFKSVMAIINRLNERNQQLHEPVKIVLYDNLLIAPDYHKVFLDESEIILTKTEIDILFYLVCNRGLLFSHQQIYYRIWGYEYDGSSYENVKGAIKRLRKKIGDKNNDNGIIENIKSIGYRVPIIPK